MWTEIPIFLQTTVWYIVDSAWIASWLAYVHFDTAIAPAPGPCRNDRLLAWSDDESKYIGRFGLFMAVKNRAGDYRRVSKPTWDKFCSFYPGSGPSITMELSKETMNETGIYDTSKWNVVDPPPPPEKTHKKKKKRFGFRNKKDTGAGKDDGAAAAVRSEDDADDQPQRPAPESKEGEVDFADIYGRASEETGGTNTGSGKDSARLSSQNETDGLMEPDSVRSSSIAHGAKRDSVSVSWLSSYCALVD